MPGLRNGRNLSFRSVRVATWLRSTLMSRSRNSARSWCFAATTAGSNASAGLSYPPQSSSIVSSADARARLKAHRAAALPVYMRKMPSINRLYSLMNWRKLGFSTMGVSSSIIRFLNRLPRTWREGSSHGSSNVLMVNATLKLLAFYIFGRENKIR